MQPRFIHLFGAFLAVIGLTLFATSDTVNRWTSAHLKANSDLGEQRNLSSASPKTDSRLRQVHGLQMSSHEAQERLEALGDDFQNYEFSDANWSLEEEFSDLIKNLSSSDLECLLHAKTPKNTPSSRDLHRLLVIRHLELNDLLHASTLDHELIPDEWYPIFIERWAAKEPQAAIAFYQKNKEAIRSKYPHQYPSRNYAKLALLNGLTEHDPSSLISGLKQIELSPDRQVQELLEHIRRVEFSDYELLETEYPDIVKRPSYQDFKSLRIHKDSEVNTGSKKFPSSEFMSLSTKEAAHYALENPDYRALFLARLKNRSLEARFLKRLPVDMRLPLLKAYPWAHVCRNQSGEIDLAKIYELSDGFAKAKVLTASEADELEGMWLKEFNEITKNETRGDGLFDF